MSTLEECPLIQCVIVFVWTGREPQQKKASATPGWTPTPISIPARTSTRWKRRLWTSPRRASRSPTPRARLAPPSWTWLGRTSCTPVRASWRRDVLPSPSASPPLPRGLKSSRSWCAESASVGQERLSWQLLGPDPAGGLAFRLLRWPPGRLRFLWGGLCVFDTSVCFYMPVFADLWLLGRNEKQEKGRGGSSFSHQTCLETDRTDWKWTKPTLAISLVYEHGFFSTSLTFQAVFRGETTFRLVRKQHKWTCGRVRTARGESAEPDILLSDESWDVWTRQKNQSTFCLCHTWTIPLLLMFIYLRLYEFHPGAPKTTTSTLSGWR